MSDSGEGLERLHKAMARAGVASRRRCEEYIAAGRVSVNGVIVTQLGTRVRAGLDRIALDGHPIGREDRLYCVVYKPRGYLTTMRDPHGSRVITDLLRGNERLYPVGRLDLDSEGLVLLTNDGEATLLLTHPRYEHEKEYRVLVRGSFAADSMARLRDGIALGAGDSVAHAEVSCLPEGWRWRDEPVPAGGRWLAIVLREGQKRQIRRMLGTVGLHVERLIRVRMGPLTLGALKPGEGRWLSREEAESLRRSVGLPVDGTERSPQGQS